MCCGHVSRNATSFLCDLSSRVCHFTDQQNTRSLRLCSGVGLEWWLENACGKHRHQVRDSRRGRGLNDDEADDAGNPRRSSNRVGFAVAACGVHSGAKIHMQKRAESNGTPAVDGCHGTREENTNTKNIATQEDDTTAHHDDRFRTCAEGNTLPRQESDEEGEESTENRMEMSRSVPQ